MKRIPFAAVRSGSLLAALLCGASHLAQAQSPATPAPSAAAPRTAAAEKPQFPGLPNFGRVHEFLYRGAQPRPEGYDQLRQLGIALVVDLHNRGPEQQREHRAVESRGMRYAGIPASSTHGPSAAQMAEFLRLLRENPRKKIFVHCQLGADRTGVMIAAFRMAEQGWTPEEALAEMRRFHFHHLWLPSMTHTIKNFPADFETNPAFASLRTSSSSGH